MADQTLLVQPGATLNQPVLIASQALSYAPITAIQPSAPLRLTVSNHGLVREWPIWIENVRSWTELNRSRAWEAALMARVIDTSTLEINALNGVGHTASGGQVVYRKQIDLSGCTARARIIGLNAPPLELTTENGGITLSNPGLAVLHLSTTQTAAIAWQAGTYSLDVIHADNTVVRYAEGRVQMAKPGLYSAEPDVLRVTALASQGPPGPAGPPGAGASGVFVWEQSIPLAVWTVPHNQNRYPAVTVTDAAGNVVQPDVRYVDDNIVQVSHGLPMTGSVYL